MSDKHKLTEDWFADDPPTAEEVREAKHCLYNSPYQRQAIVLFERIKQLESPPPTITAETKEHVQRLRNILNFQTQDPPHIYSDEPIEAVMRFTLDDWKFAIETLESLLLKPLEGKLG